MKRHILKSSEDGIVGIFSSKKRARAARMDLMVKHDLVLAEGDCIYVDDIENTIYYQNDIQLTIVTLNENELYI